VLLALGDIGERDDGAVNDVVQVSVWTHPHQKTRAALGHRDLALDRDQCAENLLHVLAQPVVGQVSDDVAD
jgi:hypothetical protein